MVAEVLANKIRSSEELKGISVRSGDSRHNLKITQLADGTTLFLKNANEIPIAVSIVEEFGKYSGLKLNKNKTEGLLVGKLKTNNETHINDIKFSKGVKALGTYFTNDKKESENLNWSNKIEECMKLINIWKKRNLSMFGKITIVKTLILPKLAYIIQAISIPNKICKQINSMIFKFVWGNNSEKIKRKTLIGNKLEGGLEVPDVELFSKTLKLKWLKSLTSEEEANWKIIPNFFLNQYGENLLILKMNVDSLKSLPPIQYTLSLFYNEILTWYIDLNNLKPIKKPNTFYDIRTQVMWGNRYIKFKGKCLIFKDWIKSGLVFVNDIINDKGEINETFILAKLSHTRNWISELSRVRHSIPNSWKPLLKADNSIKSMVSTNFSTPFNRNCNINQLNNKAIKNKFLSKSFEQPYVHGYWETKFNKEINWYPVYFTLHKVLVDNRIKQLKIKLIHKIVPTNENLFKWKQVDSPLCKHCREIESLEHLFIECSYIEHFWNNMRSLFRSLGICKTFSMFELVIGYKTEFKEYQDINIILSQVFYTIYKGYIKSERRTNQINMLKILYYDLLTLCKYFESKIQYHKLLCKFKNKLSDII